jgi:hypothetical protein
MITPNQSFRITKELINYDKWTFDEIEKRAMDMAEEALKIWQLK